MVGGCVCILSCDWLQDPGGIVRAEHRYREGGAERKQLEAAELNQLLRELRDKEAQLAGQLGERHRGEMVRARTRREEAEAPLEDLPARACTVQRGRQRGNTNMTSHSGLYVKIRHLS